MNRQIVSKWKGKKRGKYWLTAKEWKASVKSIRFTSFWTGTKKRREGENVTENENMAALYMYMYIYKKNTLFKLHTKTLNPYHILNITLVQWIMGSSKLNVGQI